MSNEVVWTAFLWWGVWCHMFVMQMMMLSSAGFSQNNLLKQSHARLAKTVMSPLKGKWLHKAPSQIHFSCTFPAVMMQRDFFLSANTSPRTRHADLPFIQQKITVCPFLLESATFHSRFYFLNSDHACQRWHNIYTCFIHSVQSDRNTAGRYHPEGHVGLLFYLVLTLFCCRLKKK